MNLMQEVSLNKTIIKLLIIIVFCFNGCDEYSLLFPVEYEGEVNHEIQKKDIFLFGEKPMKISSNTIGLECDSTLYIFVDLQVKIEDKELQEKTLYSIIDANNLVFKPYTINISEKGPEKNGWNFNYRIMFYDEKISIKLPIKFIIEDINKKEHRIIFNK